jgi:hypothetical protein
MFSIALHQVKGCSHGRAPTTVGLDLPPPPSLFMSAPDPSSSLLPLNSMAATAPASALCLALVVRSEAAVPCAGDGNNIPIAVAPAARVAASMKAPPPTLVIMEEEAQAAALGAAGPSSLGRPSLLFQW